MKKNYVSGNETLILVHAFNPLASSSQGILAITDKKVSREDSEKQAINILENPHLINNRISLSMSLISTTDDEKQGTWGNCGYIIEVPNGDVISTSVSDNGSRNSNSEELKRQQEQNIRGNNILSPEELIAKTSSSHNEVLAFASNAKITGCFVKVGIDGKDLDPELSRKVRAVAKKLGVECIEIKMTLKESDAVAKSFQDVSIYDFRETLFIGFVEGLGMDAIKYDINISKNENKITSTYCENWKIVSGADRPTDHKATDVIKTREILEKALKKGEISEEQSRLIKSTSIMRELVLSDTNLQEELPTSIPTQPNTPTTSPRSSESKGSRYGCFSAILNKTQQIFNYINHTRR